MIASKYVVMQSKSMLGLMINVARETIQFCFQLKKKCLITYFLDDF